MCQSLPAMGIVIFRVLFIGLGHKMDYVFDWHLLKRHSSGENGGSSSDEVAGGNAGKSVVRRHDTDETHLSSTSQTWSCFKLCWESTRLTRTSTW